MVTAVWSTKGGVGVSTVAAMLAIAQSERASDSLLVDLGGDQPALLGVSEPDGPGVAEWVARPDTASGALGRIEIEVQPRLKLLPRGNGSLGNDGLSLTRALNGSERNVVIDVGLVSETGFAHEVVAASPHRLLVVRSCYLALRRAAQAPVAPTGVVLIRERGRALGRADVEAVVDAPVVAQVAFDVAIARAIDAGLIGKRLPRALLRSMARVIPDAA